MTITYEPMAKVSDKRGLALFEEIVDEIEAHRFATWRQLSWLGQLSGDGLRLDNFRPEVQEALVPAFDCGTVACLFGHAAFKGGAQFWVTGTDGYISTSQVMVDGKVEFISVYAARLLQLFDELADFVSSGNREWADILEFREAWRKDAAIGPRETAARFAVVDRFSAQEYE